jgi:hypothetical protein
MPKSDACPDAMTIVGCPGLLLNTLIKGRGMFNLVLLNADLDAHGLYS